MTMGVFDWLPGFKDKVIRSGVIAGPMSLFHLNNEDIRVPRKGKEHGVSGTEVYQEKVKQLDYNPEWLGQKGIALANKMRKSDGSIRSVLQTIKLPLLRATWRVSPTGEDGGDDRDKEIAKFCQRALIAADHRTESWDTVLRHILLMLDFGFSCVEKVWTVDEDGKYVLERLAPRLPQTIKDFEVNRDGSLKFVIQEAMKNGRMQTLPIPAKYACVISYEKEGDNFWGTSLLRFLYMHYFYKTEMYKIDAVRLDRFGIGIPLAEIKEGYVIKTNEKREVIDLLKGLRSHERAFAMLPEEIKLKILTPENEHGGASGLMESVDHHDVMMARAILALFLTAGSQKHGNYGTTVTWQDLFLYSLQSLAIQIGQELNTQIVRDLCDYNFPMKGRLYPKVEASTLEDTNVKELAAALYNLVLGQVIIPDDVLEAHIRRLMAFPIKQEGYKREELGIMGQAAGSPALAAPNTTGEPSPDDKEALARAGKTGTPPGTAKPGVPPPSGPIRVPGSLG